MSPHDTKGGRKVDFLAVCLLGKCPRCSQDVIFSKFLGLKRACSACGLDLGPYDQADGPAFFVILVSGAVMVPLALWLTNPNVLGLAVGAAITAVLTTGLVLVGLRLMKALLLATQYRTDAREINMTADQER